MSCGMTSMLMGNGYWSLGDRGFAPFQGGTNVFSISDSFDMIRGKHDIHVGIGVRAQQMNVETNAFQDGFLIPFGGLRGDASADILLGPSWAAASMTRLSPAPPPDVGGRCTVPMCRTIGVFPTT